MGFDMSVTGTYTTKQLKSAIEESVFGDEVSDVSIGGSLINFWFFSTVFL